MTKNPFDQFSKQLFKEFLTPLGLVETNYEIPGEAKYVDIWFTPSTQPTIDRQDLGILSRIAATPCLLEPYRKQPTEREIRSCLGKLSHLEEYLQREAKQDEESIPEDELPRLWIIASSISDKLLNKLIATPDEAWLPGIYFPSKVFLTGFIAINKLPRTPETLWLRILGKGVIQQQAIDEVIALPKEDSKRSAALKLLATWKISMEVSNEVDLEERELIMNLSKAYLEWEQETELRGLERGMERGMEQERRQLLENLFLARFGEVDPQLATIVQPILNLPPQEYASLLLQLSSLSREELLARFM
ncbi:MAG: hypothetical protein KME64_01080 [Scytonematopsis contorta HA4267-MV1]|jgi:hypothetical protein|nr:hypothetical protein [Scytonematopsis contorta HA4267-MV1]